MGENLRISDRDQRIASMWLAGLKGEDIAAAEGKSRTVILRRARALGLPHRLSTKGKRENLWPHIARWAKQGRSPIEIATGIGCTKPEVVASIGATTCGTNVKQLAVRVQAARRARKTTKKLQFWRQQMAAEAGSA